MLLLGCRTESNRTVKQADTILLAYPLNWNMSRDILKNDLEYYEDRYALNTPAMTYSFMTVGFKFAEDPSKTRSYFLKSYQDYMVQPFKVRRGGGERRGLSKGALSDRLSADELMTSTRFAYLPGVARTCGKGDT